MGGVGAAVLGGSQIGNLGVALAFGLSLLAMVYTIGPILGCHVNPAGVTFTPATTGTVLGVTDEKSPAGFAGLAIGLMLTLVHLVGIQVTNTSVNPARSIGQPS
jgi:glycerol uptake facilitator-like aquaporin